MKKKALIIGGGLLAVVLLLVGISTVAGGPVVLSLSLGDPSAEAADAASAPEQTAVIPKPDPRSLPPGSGVMVDLGSKVINLADPGGYRYLRVGLVLEFAPHDFKFYEMEGEAREKEEEHIREKVTAQRAILDDAIIGVISDKAFSDIFSLQGKEQLKQELCGVLNEQLEGLDVVRVYFTDFLVQ